MQKLSEEDGQAYVTFTHAGLVPLHESFDICSKALTNYINVAYLFSSPPAKENHVEATGCV